MIKKIGIARGWVALFEVLRGHAFVSCDFRGIFFVRKRVRGLMIGTKLMIRASSNFKIMLRILGKHEHSFVRSGA